MIMRSITTFEHDAEAIGGSSIAAGAAGGAGTKIGSKSFEIKPAF